MLTALLMTSTFLLAQSGGSQPVRYQAEYTRIYSDDVEAVSPSVSAGFVLGAAGSFTSTASETISGKRSIKGAYSGQGTWQSYLQTDPAVLPLAPNHAYQVTFRYRILAAPNQSFNVRFYSPTAGNAGIRGPAQVVVSGPAGTSDPYIVAVETVRPGLPAPPSFSVNGKQYVAALATSGAMAGLPSRPARPGETLVLYGIGFGAVAPNLSAGTLVGRANTLANPVEIRFGNTPAGLAYYGLAPGATGLYQFNVVVPDVPDNAAVPLTFSLAGTIPSQTLYIAVQQ